MKKWQVNYCGNIIVVENRLNSERLYVNGELQDEQFGFGAIRSRLWGKLQSDEIIKVSIGSVLRMHCRIFIDNKLVLSD